MTVQLTLDIKYW